MEKALGFRLMDAIKEVSEFEISKEELLTALYMRKTQDKIDNGIESIENSLKAQALIYGVKYENYVSRIQEIKENYLKEINRIKEEYQFQFVNIQLELREALANQKIAIVNAKKMTDMKNEFMQTAKYKEYISLKSELEDHLNNALKKSDYDKYLSLLENLENPINVYIDKKNIAIQKFQNSDALIKSCEVKLNYCMNETYSEIEKIIEDNVENALLVLKENSITKIINKVINLFSGKSKFENKVKTIENNVEKLSKDSDSKVESIKENTIKLVAEILSEKEKLDSENAA